MMNSEPGPWFSPQRPAQTMEGEEAGRLPHAPSFRPDHASHDWAEDPAAVPESAGSDQRSAASDPSDHGVELAPYEIPQVPEIGWDPATSRRRLWIGRGLLFGVLAVQAALSLRLHSDAHPDETVSVIVGRDEVNHLFFGTTLTTGLIHQFPGAPWLYPVLAGSAWNNDGLFGVRLLSLIFALLTTSLLYSLTRRLFNERVAICGAGSYAVLQSTVVVGFYAAPDALAILLIALAAWIVVYTDRASLATVLLAVPVAALAVGTEYASVLMLPTLVALAVITGWPHRGAGGALLRGLLLAAGTLGLLLPLGALAGVGAGTLARGQGAESVGSIISAAAQWGGLFTLLACAGAVAYVIRERMNETPEEGEITASRPRRAALGLALCATALLVPVLQIYLHTSAVMFRHIGFSMLFAAPLAGVGITRLVGAHFRQPQLGILVWVVLLAMGLAQSTLRFQDGPDSGALIRVLRAHIHPQSHYLTEVDGLPEYYLNRSTRPDQWTWAHNGTDYQSADGAWHHGQEGTLAAIRDGYFNLAILDSAAPAAEDRAISKALSDSGHYRLIAEFASSTGDTGTYRVFLTY